MRRALAVASLVLPLGMWADEAAAARQVAPATPEPDVPEKAGTVRRSEARLAEPVLAC
ncbi:MAG: hypothetical protein ACRD3C_13030 [Vicinamibacterales bacterium]